MGKLWFFFVHQGWQLLEKTRIAEAVSEKIAERISKA
jgi:hypothetical protein